MEISSIFFQGISGGLRSTAARESGLQDFEERFGRGDFGLDLYPGAAVLASGQVFAVIGNPG
jgi:hypothetical protein